jgi:hypothetical protein
MYSTGTVYKIICLCDSNIVYIGSTFNQLKQRWQQHKNQFRGGKINVSIYPYFDKYGLENFKCLKIKEYLVYREHQTDSKHLHVYEQLWIAKTGKKCINKNNAINIQWVANKNFNILNKEYNKERYEKNKQEILQQRKDYREENKEKIAHRKKEYYKENKQEILQQQKEHYEENKQEILQQQKEYREKNKQEIAQKKKEKVECNNCGSVVTKSHLLRHKRTNKCQNHIE